MKRCLNISIILTLVMAVLFIIDCNRKPKKPGGVAEVLIKAAKYEFKKPMEKAKLAERSFHAEFPNAAVNWNFQTGYIKQVSNFVADRFSDTINVVTSSVIFLKSHADLFGLDTNRTQLQVVNESYARGSDHKSITNRFVRFAQVERIMKNLIPVYGGEIIVHLTSNRRVHTVYSSFFPLREVKGRISIKDGDAIRRVRDKLKNKPKTTDKSYAALVIYPRNGEGIICWRVIVDHWLGIVNGDDGNIILLTDNARYVNDALVYDENLINTPNPQVRPLTNLCGTGYLVGGRFQIYNDQEAMVYSANNEFREPTSDPNFDDQMVYYHLERIATYFDGTLDAQVPVPFDTLPAHTRISSMSCNAYYDPDNELFAFTGPGSVPCEDCECKCPAHYADVIYHEYTHRVLDQLIGLNYDYTESGSIHEGTADYYSCSMCGNACNGENWLSCKRCLRDISVNYIYPKDMANEPHDGGQVWASALWTLREKLGSKMTDIAVREGMRGLPINADFTTYAGNIVVNGAAYYLNMMGDNPWVNVLLILAASAVTEGAKEAFCEHGIPISYGPYVDMLIQTPEEDGSLTQTINVPVGNIVDQGRGCKGGYDILGANSWEDLKYFNDNKSSLEEYSENLTNTSLTVHMKVPSTCGEDVRRVWLIYRLYYKD